MADARIAVVVGAGDYIGSAIAKRFAREGFTIAAGRRNGDELSPLVEAIADEGGTCHGFSLDAREEEQITDFFAKVEKDIGPIEVCVFNVGGNVNFPIRDTTTRVFTKVWQMACLAGFLTGREAANYMVPRQRGAIFFTGATASLRGGIGYAAFASAKFGLRALAQSMARELGPANIHVAHLIIDAGVDTAWVRERIKQAGGNTEIPEGRLLDPASVGETYWQLYSQPKDAWTFELDIRPNKETW